MQTPRCIRCGNVTVRTRFDECAGCQTKRSQRMRSSEANDRQHGFGDVVGRFISVRRDASNTEDAPSELAAKVRREGGR